jgi:hypothetical protein
VVTDAHELEADGEARLGGIISPLAWVLLAAAGVHFLAYLLLRSPASYPLFPPEPSDLLFALRASSSFGLAAAVLVGADNWSAGRRWLTFGVASLAVQGALELVGQGTMYWVLEEAWETPARTGSIQPLLYLRGFASAFLAALAPLLLAAGVWRGAQNRSTPGPRRSWLAGIVALMTLLALAASLWLALEVVRRTPEVWYGAFWEVLMAIQAAAMGVLAIAAVRGVGPRALLPEALIAIGATLFVLGTGWSSVAILSSIFDPPGAATIVRAYPIPAIMIAVGLVATAFGFASGRLVPRPEG